MVEWVLADVLWELHIQGRQDTSFCKAVKTSTLETYHQRSAKEVIP